jgi:hypothetical protein
MHTICLIDTSVFCELVVVPNLAREPKRFQQEFRRRAKAGEAFVLPMATIIETGNHIGQNGDGSQRRVVAERFVALVRTASVGNRPFTMSPMVEPADLAAYLDRFVEWASRSDVRGKGSGLGDLTIFAEWDRQRRLNPGRRVYVWSLDAHLSAYDTPA